MIIRRELKTCQKFSFADLKLLFVTSRFSRYWHRWTHAVRTPLFSFPSTRIRAQQRWFPPPASIMSQTPSTTPIYNLVYLILQRLIILFYLKLLPRNICVTCYKKKEHSLCGCVSPDGLSGLDSNICSPSHRHWGLIIFCKVSPCFCTSSLLQILVNLALPVVLVL